MSDNRLIIDAQTGQTTEVPIDAEEQAERAAAADPTVVYNKECETVETIRRAAYEAQSDPLFFEWQRGDGTEQAWRDSVAAVKAANPYPPAP